MSLFESTLIGAAVLLGLAALVFWIAMIRDCWRNTTAGSRERWVWLAVVVLGKTPGAVAYYLLRRQRYRGLPASST